MCSWLQLAGHRSLAGRRSSRCNSNSYGIAKFGVESAFVITARRCSGQGVVMNLTVTRADGKKPKRTMLPFLVVLFLISYGLLTVLVMEQDRTIDSQRSLIHLLFKDNVHLSALRGGKNLGYAAGTTTHTQSSQSQLSSSQIPLIEVPSNQVPSNQVPSNQVPSNQVPSNQASSNRVPDDQVRSKQVPSNQGAASQAKTLANGKGQKTRKAQKPLPVTPPTEMTDPSDTRRVSFSI